MTDRFDDEVTQVRCTLTDIQAAEVLRERAALGIVARAVLTEGLARTLERLAMCEVFDDQDYAREQIENAAAMAGV
jgi:hypothetical protein